MALDLLVYVSWFFFTPKTSNLDIPSSKIKLTPIELNQQTFQLNLTKTFTLKKPSEQIKK